MKKVLSLLTIVFIVLTTFSVAQAVSDPSPGGQSLFQSDPTPDHDAHHSGAGLQAGLFSSKECRDS